MENFGDFDKLIRCSGGTRCNDWAESQMSAFKRERRRKIAVSLYKCVGEQRNRVVPGRECEVTEEIIFFC